VDALSRLSLRNRALTALLTIFLIVAGAYVTGTLKRELIPSIEFPVIGVVTPAPGASATTVEERVTKPVERAILGLRGVDKVESSSSANVSTVMVTLDYDTDLGQAQTDAQRAVLNIQDLPDGSEPQVFAGSISDFPIIQMSVSGGADQQELLAKVRDQMVPQIEDIEGVREAQVSGVTDQVVRIDVDARKLAAAAVSPTALTDLLEKNGVLVPAGQLTSGTSDLSVQVGSPITSIDDLKALPLPTSADGPTEPEPQPTTRTTGPSATQPGATGQPTGAATAAPTATATSPSTPATTVLLGDVATVALVDADQTTLSRTGGQPSLTVAITKTPDGNTVAISKALEELRPELDRMVTDGRTTIVFDQAPFIEKSVEDLTTEGLLGLAFAVLVVFVFLLSLRLTLVTAVSIPLSLLIAMIGLDLAGFTLNILTLGALTIAVGRVVDDSIVVIENIQRHLRMGEPRRDAIPRAVKEVATAITSSTLATVAVFLPLALVGGQVGELFRPFALTVTVAMLASLFVALTIVPVLGYWFLRGRDRAAPATVEAGSEAAAYAAHDPGAPVPAAAGPVRIREQDEPVTRLQRSYLPVLGLALRRPVVTMLVGLIILGASGFGATRLKTDFLGSQGGNTLIVQQQLPAGAALEETDAAAKEVEKELAKRDDLESYQVTIGSAGLMAAFLGGGANTATFNLTTVEGADLDGITADIRSFGEKHPDVGLLTVTTGMSGPGATAAEIVVQAPNDKALREAASAITEQMKKIREARDVSNDLAALVPTVKVEVDRAKANRIGLSETAVGGMVAAALRGSNLGEVTFGGVGHDVVLRQGEAPATVDELKALAVGVGPDGAPLTLGSVATVEQVEEPVSLSRVDGARSATVSATPNADDLGAVTAALNRIVADTELPSGATAVVGGVSADQAKAFSQLGLALLIAIAITYAVLVGTFGSLLQPLILMMSIPFAATGAVGLLLLTDTPLGVASMIGLLMLVGIVVTNAIVLIDLVNQYRARGLGIREAVLEGGRHRLRPIVMTALATVLALSPMALAITGGGAFISQPLAIVVIGGLVSSTLLTLLLVPALYVLVEEFRHKRGYGADHLHEV
jgi:HAE1 family hydrophobic/amphiphilic exporter-1